MIGITATYYRVEMETSHHKASNPGQLWTTTSVHAYKADAISQSKKTAPRTRVVEVRETVVHASNDALVTMGKAFT